MALFKLKAKYKPAGDQPKAIKKLINGIKKNYRFQTLLGVTGSGKTFSVANVIERFKMPVLVIAPNKALAAQLYREYKNFFPENAVHYFVSYYDYYQPEAYIPTTDTYIEKEAMINEEIDRLRHAATSSLMTRRDVIVVASVSCIYNLGLPENYWESALHLANFKPMTRGDLIKQLVKIQFQRTKGQLARGLFRVVGDNFEIMPAKEANIIYRVALQNQKVAEIWTADVLTKKNIEKLREIVIFPPKHFVMNRNGIDRAVMDIKKELNERLEYFEKEKMYLEAERLRRRTLYDMEMLNTLGYCHGIENYSRHLTGKLAGEPTESLLAYFDAHNSAVIPAKAGIQVGGTNSKSSGFRIKCGMTKRNNKAKKHFLTVIDESHISVPQIRGMYEGDRARKQTLIKYGWRLPSALDNRPLKFDEFLERVGQVIFTSATPGDFEKKNSNQTAEQIIRPTGLIDPAIEVRPVFDKAKNFSQIDDLLGELRIVIKNKERAIVNTLTKKMAEELNDFFLKYGLKSNYLHSDIKTLERTEILKKFRQGKFDVLIGVNLLREGLDLPEVALVAILDADREGFLRSETSLIQTMGRTARNVRGKVILYADKMTGSIKRAVGEVERRRVKQEAYNKKHGIKPQSIEKEIEDFLEIEK